MRKIIAVVYLTMDGVMQAPGTKDEDPSNGFQWGGWNMQYWDKQMEEKIGSIMSRPFDLLLGRLTYEIFAAHWPYQEDEISETFNRINKYVVATTHVDLSWKNSILINKDVFTELKKLKDSDGPDLVIFGSGQLIRSLLPEDFIDVLYIWTFPVTLGNGKKLFENAATVGQWKLTDSMVSSTGVLVASYIPDGDVQLPSVETHKVSKAELARRQRWNEKSHSAH